MLRSGSERRLSIALNIASRANQVEQTLLLDQIHRDLLLAETAIQAVSLLDGLVMKTRVRSGFHNVLQQHPILDEILALIRADHQAAASRYATDMISGWRYDTPMMDWAQHHYDSIVPSNVASSVSGSILPHEWFVKFQSDLLQALHYIQSEDLDLVYALQDRIQACLLEIDQEDLVWLLLQINDATQAVIDEGMSPALERHIAEIHASITSLYFESGRILTSGQGRQYSQISHTVVASEQCHPVDDDEPDDGISVMFASIALRNREITTPDCGQAGSHSEIVRRFDPVFGDRCS